MSAPRGGELPFPLEPGEQLLRSGRANMQRGAETVGGTLHLTSDRLVFVPHSLNLSSAPSGLRLADIAAVAPAWTKLLGVLPLANNSLALTLRDGNVESYVVPGRKDWMDAIDRARGGDASVR